MEKKGIRSVSQTKCVVFGRFIEQKDVKTSSFEFSIGSNDAIRVCHIECCCVHDNGEVGEVVADDANNNHCITGIETAIILHSSG